MIIKSPLSVPQSKSKMFILNLNVYRNSHFRVLNKVKQVYKDLIKHQILLLPEFSKITLVFHLYPKSNRMCDISNVLSIHDKFFCDALVELGKLPDDNYKYIPEVKYVFREVDKLNPRVDIYIDPII